ncbi:hypothetical protein Dimus_009300 [Dionaea muscipula]
MEGKSSKNINIIGHVLLFPNPQPGHINPFLDLAELLCASGKLPHVTFLTTLQMQHRLVNHSNVVSRFAPYPGIFHLRGISDDLTPSDPLRTVTGMVDSYKSLYTTTRALLKAMLASGEILPVTCFIADGSLEFLVDVAEEFGIPVVTFHTMSAALIWLCFCIAQESQSQQPPPEEDHDTDRRIYKDKGLGILRAKDITTSPQQQLNQLVVSAAARHQQAAKATVFNTFEELEGPFLTYIRSTCPNTFAIGPLHTHLITTRSSSSSNNFKSSGTAPPISSILKEDKSCLEWLDSQPIKSVVYVSFGSQAVLTRDELLELWHGLVSSGHKFLWVMRESLVVDQQGEDNNNKKEEFEEEYYSKEERSYYVVPWAPQKDVLAHPAIGSFLTHCGWNSTLEALAAGVPMICWPHYGDQQLNGRCLSEIYKVGVYLKDYACERATIARVVNEAMKQNKDDESPSASFAALARKAVTEGGSSFKSFDQLIDFIQSLVNPIEH